MLWHAPHLCYKPAVILLSSRVGRRLVGHLVAAVVFALELVVDTMDDVVLRRAPDPETGLVLWKQEAPTTSAAPGWTQVIEASQPAPPPVRPVQPELEPESADGEDVVQL